TYDAIGNLVTDDQEGISEISWNVYGKISSITKSGPVTITYEYDASGNRIGKTVGDNPEKHTWYVRDASGNVMAVYEDENSSINNGELSQIEVHLYGSARLGMWQANRNVASPSQPIETALTGLVEGGVTVGRERGEKIFELSNHLGNVLVTVSDRRVEHNTSGTTIDYYEASVVSATDYAPFGFGLVERKYASGGYRYGFNGKENDNDVKGIGDQQNYGLRIYDSRLGRFLSVDPLAKEYPWNSSYAFAENDVIRSIDLDGAEKLDRVQTVEYKGDALDILRGAENGLREAFNSGVIDSWNSGVDFFTSLFNGTLGEDLLTEGKQIANNIKDEAVAAYNYHTTKSIGQQINDFGNYLTQPERVADVTIFLISVRNPLGGSKKDLLKVPDADIPN